MRHSQLLALVVLVLVLVGLAAPLGRARAEVPAELQALCEKIADAESCPEEPSGKTLCTCSITHRATGRTAPLGGFRALRVRQKEIPGQSFVDVTHLVIESGGVWRSYGAVTHHGSDATGDAAFASLGTVDKCWCNYGVPGLGPVCVLEATDILTGTSPRLNYLIYRATTKVFLAYAKDGALVVMSLERSHVEETSALNSRRPAPDPDAWGKIGKRSWKRLVKAGGRELVVDAPSGDDPFPRATSDFKGRFKYDELGRFTDDVTRLLPLE